MRRCDTVVTLRVRNVGYKISAIALVNYQLGQRAATFIKSTF
jgi:hypothetical protein